MRKFQLILLSLLYGETVLFLLNLLYSDSFERDREASDDDFAELQREFRVNRERLRRVAWRKAI